jgi:hypothetical protein
MNYQKELEHLQKKYDRLVENYGAVYGQLHNERKKLKETLDGAAELRRLVDAVFGALALKFGEGDSKALKMEKLDVNKISSRAEWDENGDYIIYPREITDVDVEGEEDGRVNQ